MDKGIIFFFVILIFVIGNVFAFCEKNQIDINSATLEELDNLYGIGPAKAQAIIDTRPFDSIDDLINVNGIGPVTLENIKNQGLACVDSEEKTDEVEINTNSEEETSQEKEEVTKEETEKDSEKEIVENKETPNETKSFEKENENIQREIISLNSQVTKDIKIRENEENKRKNYPFLGLILFSFLIGALFLIKKRSYKNEFKE